MREGESKAYQSAATLSQAAGETRKSVGGKKVQADLIAPRTKSAEDKRKAQRRTLRCC